MLLEKKMASRNRSAKWGRGPNTKLATEELGARDTAFYTAWKSDGKNGLATLAR